jgi:hypothetical protein
MLAGATTAGAAAAVAVIAPGARDVTATATPAKKAVDPNGGYQVTEHVLRYYDTARV